VFSRCDSLTSITIPNSVTSIKNTAFSNSKSLTSITIGDGVTSIGITAFTKCTSLTTIAISAANVNYTDVNGVLFNKGKTSLCTYPEGKAGDYVIPNSVTSIGGYAFRYCTSLTSITIPDSVTSIGGSAFDSCTSLTSITIPDSVTSIGGLTFADCSSLTSITIPDSVTSITDRAFMDCTSLTAVTFLGDAPYISQDNAFGGSSPTIYRKADAKGWGDTLEGRPVKLITEKP
ncbi:leucine-rich repeat domain-containing protein, partial [Akkermansiaceae bacterium]|nr:leucine-rich repeat domain-containing protein [Akkermansiaceae bacterium]